MTARRATAQGRPWYVFIAPSIPLLALYLANTDQLASIAVVVWPLALAATVAAVICLSLILISGDVRAAALAATVLVGAGLSYVRIARAVVALGLPARFQGALPMVYFALTAVAAGALLWRLRGRTGTLTTTTNHVTVIAVAIFLFQIAVVAWRSPVSALGPNPVGASQDARDLPSVYVLILDGYGRDDVFRARYGFDNDLTPALRELGFQVASEAASNYPQTAHSLASALNVDYLQTLLSATDAQAGRRRTLVGLLSKNRVFEAFAAAGYRIRAYESEYALLRPGPVHERPRPLGFMDSFGYGAYETTIVPSALQALGWPRGWLPLQLHRRQVRWTFEDLMSSPLAGDQPHLVFAHVLAPHPPFAFNADGSARRTMLPAALSDGDRWHAIARGSGERYEEGYLASVKYINTQVLNAVRSVLRSATRPTIVYIQGDHGPAAGLKWEDPEASDVRERHGILLAMRLPEGTAAADLPPRTTPVNAFRVIANRALGANLQVLDDRSYFATLDEPFRFIDVTDRVR